MAIKKTFQLILLPLIVNTACTQKNQSIPGMDPIMGAVVLQVDGSTVDITSSDWCAAGGYLYLLSRDDGRVARVDLESGASKTIIEKGNAPFELGHPSALAVYRETLFVSDVRKKSVLTYDLDGSFLEKFVGGVAVEHMAVVDHLLVVHKHISNGLTSDVNASRFRLAAYDIEDAGELVFEALEASLSTDPTRDLLFYNVPRMAALGADSVLVVIQQSLCCGSDQYA